MNIPEKEPNNPIRVHSPVLTLLIVPLILFTVVLHENTLLIPISLFFFLLLKAKAKTGNKEHRWILWR
jgi:hypothetical protein